MTSGLEVHSTTIVHFADLGQTTAHRETAPYIHTYLSIYLSIYQSLYLSIYLYIYLSIYLSISLSLSIYIYIYIYIYRWKRTTCGGRGRGWELVHQSGWCGAVFRATSHNVVCYNQSLSLSFSLHTTHSCLHHYSTRSSGPARAACPTPGSRPTPRHACAVHGAIVDTSYTYDSGCLMLTSAHYSQILTYPMMDYVAPTESTCSCFSEDKPTPPNRAKPCGRRAPQGLLSLHAVHLLGLGALLLRHPVGGRGAMDGPEPTERARRSAPPPPRLRRPAGGSGVGRPSTALPGPHAFLNESRTARAGVGPKSVWTQRGPPQVHCVQDHKFYAKRSWPTLPHARAHGRDARTRVCDARSEHGGESARTPSLPDVGAWFGSPSHACPCPS